MQNWRCRQQRGRLAAVTAGRLLKSLHKQSAPGSFRANTCTAQTPPRSPNYKGAHTLCAPPFGASVNTETHLNNALQI